MAKVKKDIEKEIKLLEKLADFVIKEDIKLLKELAKR